MILLQMKLWLLECHPEATRNLKNEAKLRGIDANRLIFGLRLLPEAHLTRHIWIDLSENWVETPVLIGRL
jgi:predicted O-linked N-acetylglucosamine transferase (SPINDLY family)